MTITISLYDQTFCVLLGSGYLPETVIDEHGRDVSEEIDPYHLREAVEVELERNY